MPKRFTLDQKAMAAEIVAAYLACDGNISDTAVRSGRNRTTIYQYLKHWKAGDLAGVEGIPAYEPGRSLKSEVLQNADTSPQVNTPDWAVAMAEWYAKQGLAIPDMPGLPAIEPPVITPPQPTAPLLVRAEKEYRRVAFLSDIHFPYHDAVGVSVTLAYLREWKPDLVMLAGDICDFYMVSDYDRDPGRSQTIQDELDSARPFFGEIDALGADVVYLQGNHENRLMKLIGKNPGLYKLRSLEFPRAAELPQRWRWYPSQTHFKIGPLLYLHGDLQGRGGGGEHIAASLLKKLRASSLSGHHHRFNTFFQTDYDGTVRAGFSNGHLSDVAQATYVRCPNWQSGFTTVEYGQDQKVFGVQQHLIVHGRFVADGKEWSL